jgi:type III secretion system YscQ/HrcQ family protein
MREREVTNEYLENEADTVAADLPQEDAHALANKDANDEAGATMDSPHGVQDNAEYKSRAQAQEYEQEPDQDDARPEAEARFAEMGADLSEELLAVDDMEDAHSDLDSVPVALSFELGKISLPLAEVRTLGPGGVVLFSGGSPASIAIVSAGQTLGRGEIVEVEGRLGIRVTQWRTPC